VASLDEVLLTWAGRCGGGTEEDILPSNSQK
jgi:hypothetical protein